MSTIRFHAMLLVALIAIAFGQTTQVEAREIEFISAEREVRASGDGYCPGGCGPGGQEYYTISDSSSTMGAGAWQRTAVAQGWTAAQDSEISAENIFLQGSVESGWDLGSGASLFSVEFKLKRFDGWELFGDLLGGTTATLTEWGVEIWSATGSASWLPSEGRYVGTSVYFADFKRATPYVLTVTTSNYDGSEPAGFDMRLVPEPGTALLVGVGLVSLAAQRRRLGLRR